jgi:hypothetical protein
VQACNGEAVNTLLTIDLSFLNDAVRLVVSPADLQAEWREEWNERAAIMEYDGGLPRERAEHVALADIVRQMRSKPNG